MARCWVPVPEQYLWGNRLMFSIAVKGYGIVIWDGDGQWRTFGATESLSATLAARVEHALETVPTPAARRRSAKQSHAVGRRPALGELRAPTG